MRDPRFLLTAQAKARNQRLVTFGLGPPQIGEETSALTHKPKEPAPRVMVLLMDLEVLREIVDASGEQGHLDSSRTRIRARLAMLRDGFLLDRARNQR